MFEEFSNEYLEFWEYEYLKNIHNSLVLDRERMIEGFTSKEEIRGDWEEYLGKEISDFAVGSERIFYWLFNQFGQPNSSPIGSDLFFETYNAFVHIDVKTVITDNIGDINGDIFVGDNQNSYEGFIEVRGKAPRPYKGNLPPVYTKTDGTKKMCLTYFICVLYSPNGEIQFITVLSMPNGKLNDVYGNRVLKAGKNPGRIRYNFSKTPTFELLKGTPTRIKFVLVNPTMEDSVKRGAARVLSFYKDGEALEERLK
ncbi:PDDEXK family nuclease [Sporosarcina sp. CAU 1771]